VTITKGLPKIDARLQTPGDSSWSRPACFLLAATVRLRCIARINLTETKPENDTHTSRGGRCQPPAYIRVPPIQALGILRHRHPNGLSSRDCREFVIRGD